MLYSIFCKISNFGKQYTKFTDRGFFLYNDVRVYAQTQTQTPKNATELTKRM